MKRLLLFSFLLFSFSSDVWADTYVARLPDNSLIITLLPKECSFPILKEFIVANVPNVDKVGEAIVVYQGKQLNACYVVQDEFVLLVDSTGDTGSVPVTEFKYVPSI